MNQLFLGNSRVLLFKPGNSSVPVVRIPTRVWYTDDPNELPTEIEIEGTLNNSSIPNRNNIKKN